MSAKPWLLPILGSGLLLCSASSYAEWNGFATLGGAWFSNTNADYVYNNLSTGPGHSHNPDLGLDSKLGLQWTDRWHESVRVNAQALVARNSVNEFSPNITLANLAFDLSDRVSLTLGRTQNPNFIYSDHRHINYALPWVRPPSEVYGVTSIFNYDGVQATIELTRHHTQATKLVVGAAQAENHYSFDAGHSQNSLKATEMIYASLSRQSYRWLFKLSVETGRLSTDNMMLSQALDNIALTNAGLSQRLSLDHKPYYLVALGMKYDTDDHVLIAELAHRKLSAYFGQRTGAYLTYGRRLNDWMPYITLARTQTALDNDAEPIAQKLFTSARDASTSVALGASVELNAQMTLKAETKWLKPDANSGWTYANYQPGYDLSRPGEDWLFSIAVSTVF